ncbi:nicotinate-nucleotide pyrophosphorylase (carboxylating) [Pullulanibacillus pueri]|uniref:Probable nicotinate-nucleotide pyrophosphorylase [carboxylating] n=1 Tax=Pullulanibacillus pueri TaxID=1437324 RepID=A0A8J3EL90_9BACL|nr:carboxylating nicotinate-nucleotide diphosphorylase [Pullulanibacillus pueri]MBM7680819.1 nicotinate-nucleotide pyrophosphorylase (carboxylating) [Pullulanibacillus pueri]GGH78454.1 nicotinate-nucleotide diphosphorylase (carboxylating) [Pullulanibacillus pueri]
MNRLKLKEQLQTFFLEDIGEGDLTSQLLFDKNEKGEGIFTAKAEGVLSGLDVITEAYHLLDPTINVHFLVNDGDQVKKGTDIATVEGPVQPILTGERVILNLLQRMSGIATLTAQAVRLLDSQHTRLCDTRKTTPGLRMLEKYAVTCGGGYNHRMGLYDGIMIKDNHIAKMGSITAAVNRLKTTLGHMVKIEVETESAEQVKEAVEAGADIIMFDNRTPDEIRDYVPLVPSHITTEASGEITLERLPEYGKTGVDYISLGFLTHSAQALDISLNL